MRTDHTRIIQIYCGSGKGKTTAAVGQAIRACGEGFAVCFIAFLKSPSSGEFRVMQKIPGMTVLTFGTGEFVLNRKIDEENLKIITEGIAVAEEMISSRKFDLMVLDEIGHIIELEFTNEDRIIKILDIGRGWLDLVLTGRKFYPKILQSADLITCMKSLKHPFTSGITARKGIEF